MCDVDYGSREKFVFVGHDVHQKGKQQNGKDIKHLPIFGSHPTGIFVGFVFGVCVGFKGIVIATSHGER
jgi:hypothetical protein